MFVDALLRAMMANRGASAQARKISLFSGLEDFGAIACEPRASALYSGSSTTS